MIISAALASFLIAASLHLREISKRHKRQLRLPLTNTPCFFLRVNHAGERAAQTIYKGQFAVLKGHEHEAEIQHMMEQEVEHLETFDNY